MYRCPGDDGRSLRIEIRKCLNCSYEVEIFSDEIKVKCPKCKKEVYRENTPSCIDWCQYVRQCTGEKRWQELKKVMDKGTKKEKFKGG